MSLPLLLGAFVVLLCVLFNRVSNRLGIPMLAAFILLGMLFGSDGILKIPFENFFFAEQICTFALIFIMFYGGFGTKWTSAKPVADKAVLLSSAGVALTAGLTALFCHFVLSFEPLISVLMGSSYPRPMRHRFSPSCAPKSWTSRTARRPCSRSKAAATTP